MSRPRSKQPAYQFHLSGQAQVTIAGKNFYLGKHGIPESFARYHALLAENNANGMQLPDAGYGDIPGIRKAFNTRARQAKVDGTPLRRMEVLFRNIMGHCLQSEEEAYLINTVPGTRLFQHAPWFLAPSCQ